MTFSRNAAGHLAALLTILIWGTTFISTKVLLRSFSPVEILFIRFTIGYLSLLAFFPKFLPFRELRHELYYAGAGLSGVTLYFLVENIALTHTLASNVGIMVSAAPLFTALLAWLWLKRKRPGGRFFLGFGAAIAGIALIVFNGNTVLKLNPLAGLLISEERLRLPGIRTWRSLLKKQTTRPE